ATKSGEKSGLAQPTCFGDIAGNDGVINAADFRLMQAAAGFAPSHSADLDENDVVDIAGAAVLQGLIGPCP
ncbi:MAG: hypothetical protein CME06_08180, partial [Gemmatimonadetes bacterium]|nr:hypothetical protein [Gemmatimonadota bacterium]